MTSINHSPPQHPIKIHEIHTPIPEPDLCSVASSVINFPGGDVLLRTTSTPFTTFQLPSFILQTTSGFFRDVLDLPQNPQSPASTSALRGITELPVSEPVHIMEILLSMMCGIAIPEWDQWDSFDVYEEVLDLAEKWDTPGPLSYLRSTLVSPSFLDEDPLRVYTIACHLDWTPEANSASKRTLTLSLYSAEIQDKLARLASRDLMALLNLHRKRRDEFKRQLDDPQLFNAGNGSGCSRSDCNGILDNHTWRELKARMFVEIDRRPLGDTVIGVIEMEEWPEAKAAWAASCSVCQKGNYDKTDTLKNIKASLDRLPIYLSR